jgi:hypothetical protein
MPKKSKGKQATVQGNTYEEKIAKRLSELKYDKKEILVDSITAKSDSSKNDISFKIDKVDTLFFVECKNKGSFEGGGKRFKLVDNKLIIPEECIHKSLLIDYIPFKGEIPSFLKGDKNMKKWKEEKINFKDEYIRVASDTINEYYQKKGVHYIQIENYGLYHTKEDILKLGTIKFEVSTKIRIRCKQHSSSSLPSSVQASFVFSRKYMNESPVDLCVEEKLPKILEFK